MDFSAVYNQIAILFILILIGYIFGKVKIMTQEMIGSLTSYMLKVAMPAMIISGMMIERTPEKLKESVYILIIAFVTYASSFMIAKLVTKVIKPPKAHQGVFEFALMFSNVGFMGFPVMATIFGQESIFYAVIFNIAFNMCVYSVGIYLVSDSSKERKFSFKTFFNMGIIASIIGLVIFGLAIPVPSILEGVVSIIGGTTTPISMLVTGAMLSTVPVAKMFNNWRVYFVSVIRVLVLPLLVFVVLRYLFQVDHPMILGVSVIITGMPVAASAALITQEYGTEPELASQCIFTSTLISILSIPLLSLLFI